METAKKLLKKKDGFTLVELIVVLVILAILAAILVPTLLGYIDKANAEKNYSTAQTVRVAAQAVYDDEYAHGTKDNTITLDDKTASEQTVAQLAGVDSKVSACSFTVDEKTGQITGGTVTIDNAVYTLKDGAWTAAKSK